MTSSRFICHFAVAASLFVVAGCGESQRVEEEEEAPRYSDYLRADNYYRLVIEVDSVATVPPSQNAEDQVVQALSALLDKPGGVEVIRDQHLDSRGAEHQWTTEELGALLADSFDLEVPEGTLKMHAVFLDGEYAGGGHVLGLNWGDFTHLIVFKGKIQEVCTSGIYASFSTVDSQTLCDNSEGAVWLHETGHLLGLVNKGVPLASAHEDKDHPGHSVSEESAMHWSYDWWTWDGGVVEQISKRIRVNDMEPLGFGGECEADLAAAREAL